MSKREDRYILGEDPKMFPGSKWLFDRTGFVHPFTLTQISKVKKLNGHNNMVVYELVPPKEKKKCPKK